MEANSCGGLGAGNGSQTRQAILYLLTYPDCAAVNGGAIEMADFPQSFRFEQSAVSLSDGTYFQPLRQGIARWAVRSKSMYDAAPGYSFQILYELADGTFMFVEYGLCEHAESRGGEQIWIGSSPPRAGRITSEQALRFILHHQLSIPDSLSPLLAAPVKKPECRPLEYWATRPILEQKRPQMAHNVDLLVQSDLGYRFLVRLVQELRARDACWHSFKSPDSVASCLFAIYPVDPRRWWGPQSIVPPETVPLEDIEWPKDLAAVRECLVKIKSLLCLPLSAHQANKFFGSSWYPTPEEQDAAFQALQETLPMLELLVTELGRTVVAAQDADKAPQPAPTAPAESTDSASGSESKRGAGPADRQALASWERALQLMGPAGAEATDQQIYDWIKEHGLDTDLERYVLPQFDTWQRYRNRARKAREEEGKANDPPTPRSAVDREDI